MTVLKSLAVNTIISAVTYLIVSLLGLVVVPLLVNAYGIGVFGLIVLARLFLPTGGLALVDVGLGEMAVVSVAQARASRQWEQVSRQLTLLSLVALAIGIVTGAGLGFGAPVLIQWFNVEAAEATPFAHVLWATAVSLPFLFLSLVLEGVVKGYERFGFQRGCELMGSVSYALGVIWAVRTHQDFAMVCYIQVASQLLRTAVVAGGIFFGGPRRHLSLRMPHREDLGAMWQQSRPIFMNKILGATQVQAPPVLIGGMFGPAAVGIYDVLGRLPRFAKAILGLISSTLLPTAIRLDSAGDKHSRQRLSELGTVIILVLLVPPLATGVVLSEPVLRLWIGSETSQYWRWQSLMFLVPVFSVLTSYGTNFFFHRTDALRRMSNLMLVQLVLQFAIAFAATTWFHERAFILGQVLAAACIFPFQVRHILDQQELSSTMPRVFSRSMLLLGAVTVTVLLIGSPPLANLALLAIASVICALLYGALTWGLVLTADHRSQVFSNVRRLAELKRK